MEKISHIVPGKPRVSTADVKSAAPVRPGTPSFGRPVGTSTAGTQDFMTTAQKATELMTQQEEKRAREMKNAQLVQHAADQFFMSKGRSLAKSSEGRETEPRSEIGAMPRMDLKPPALSNQVSVDGPREVGGEMPSEPELISPPEKYTPRGSYIDVRA